MCQYRVSEANSPAYAGGQPLSHILGTLPQTSLTLVNEQLACASVGRRCRGEQWPLRVEHIIDGKNGRIQQIVANQVADRHVTMARATVPSG